jgi:hypothetical protein
MAASSVAVVLPVFQRDLAEVAEGLAALGGEYENVCFDLHYYHCFGDHWQGNTFAQHLRAVEEHQNTELRCFPTVVGEWSLSLGRASWTTCQLGADDVKSLFGSLQLAAYGAASHGWFFWNWKDEQAEWNWQMCCRQGWLPKRCPPSLPRWDGVGRDPLEELVDPSDTSSSRVRFGDAVFLRTFQGCYIDVQGAKVRARPAADAARSRRLVIVDADAPHLVGSAAGVGVDKANVGSTANPKRRVVRSGDRIQLLTIDGRVLAVGSGQHVLGAKRRRAAAASLTVHIPEGEPGLQHRGVLFLETMAAGAAFLDADAHDDMVRARWSDKGQWQRFIVEKIPKKPISNRCTGTSMSSYWKKTNLRLCSARRRKRSSKFGLQSKFA